MARIATVEVETGVQLHCVCPPGVAIHNGDSCIVDIGKMLDYARVTAIEDDVPDEQSPQGAVVVRQATLQDQAKAGENTLRSKMALETCVKKAEQKELQIRIIRVRFNFDRTVLNVLFSAEEHPDTREFAKEISDELRARVDLKQVGVRDEAGLIGGMGPCGRQMCCCSWLKDFESVNVKMAKAQRLSLNPSAISGNCGRLKCCLRYEYDLYREMGRHLPRQGACVKCPQGTGWVVSRNILAQTLKVNIENERTVECDAADVSETWQRRGHNRRDSDEDTDSERS